MSPTEAEAPAPVEEAPAPMEEAVVPPHPVAPPRFHRQSQAYEFAAAHDAATAKKLAHDAEWATELMDKLINTKSDDAMRPGILNACSVRRVGKGSPCSTHRSRSRPRASACQRARNGLRGVVQGWGPLPPTSGLASMHGAARSLARPPPHLVCVHVRAGPPSASLRLRAWPSSTRPRAAWGSPLEWDRASL